jgi:hypothetical protein
MKGSWPGWQIGVGSVFNRRAGHPWFSWKVMRRRNNGLRLLRRVASPSRSSRARYASLALIDKFDTACISAPPDHAAVLRRLEAIQRQVKFEGGGMMCVGVKHGSAVVDIHHPAGMTAANAIDAEQRQPVNGNTFQGSTFKHRTSPFPGKASRFYGRARSLKGRLIDLLKHCLKINLNGSSADAP